LRQRAHTTFGECLRLRSTSIVHFSQNISYGCLGASSINRNSFNAEGKTFLALYERIWDEAHLAQWKIRQSSMRPSLLDRPRTGGAERETLQSASETPLSGLTACVSPRARSPLSVRQSLTRAAKTASATIGNSKAISCAKSRQKCEFLDMPLEQLQTWQSRSPPQPLQRLAKCNSPP
jgi:hypothetical protein